MQSLGARQTERVEYDGEVELRAGSSADGLRHIVARATDLSEGGIGIAAPIELSVGEVVICTMNLDGRPASLPGRVAWTRTPESNGNGRGGGVGVRFDTLTDLDSGMLRHVVERAAAGYRPVELKFPGFPEPVTARARATTKGVRLSAALPLLSRGRELSFRLDEEGPLFQGRVTNASMCEDHGERRLELDVEVLEQETPRFRKHTMYGHALELERREALASATQAAIVLHDTAPQQSMQAADETTQIRLVTGRAPNAPRRARVQAREERLPPGGLSRATPWLSMALAAAAASLLTWLVMAQSAAKQAEHYVRPRPLVPHYPASSEPIASPAPASIPSGAVPQPVPLPEDSPESALQSTPATLASVPGPAPLSSAAMSSPPASRPEAADPEAAQERETRPARPPSPTVEAAPPPALNGPAAASPDRPEAEAARGETRVRLPYRGTLEGLKTRLWADPVALALELPDGTTPLEPGNYPLRRGLAQHLRVHPRKPGTRLRVLLNRLPGSYTVQQSEHGLEITLMHPTRR